MKQTKLLKKNPLAKQKRSQISLQTDIESSCGKLTPKNLKDQVKKKQIRKRQKAIKSNKEQNKKIILHERIYRFKMKHSRKTMRIMCFKQSDMGWDKKLCNIICQQELDNDIESDSQLIENQIQRCKKSLLSEIKHRQQLKNNQNSQK